MGAINYKTYPEKSSFLALFPSHGAAINILNSLCSDLHKTCPEPRRFINNARASYAPGRYEKDEDDSRNSTKIQRAADCHPRLARIVTVPENQSPRFIFFSFFISLFFPLPADKRARLEWLARLSRIETRVSDFIQSSRPHALRGLRLLLNQANIERKKGSGAKCTHCEFDVVSCKEKFCNFYSCILRLNSSC